MFDPQPIYTKRNNPVPTTISYNLDHLVRQRILHTLLSINGLGLHGTNGLDAVLTDVANRCMREYGALRGKDSRTGGRTGLEHWQNCSSEEAIDFLEMVLQSYYFPQRQRGANAINNIFREEGIGYSFTEYVEQDLPITKKYPKGSPAEKEAIRISKLMGKKIYPQAIKLTNELVHSGAVMPVLHFLTDPRFATTNGEMLDAHKHFRAGDWGAAINACQQSFESVLKTIYSLKNWSYDPKAATAKLIEVGRDNGLFPPFYVEAFKLTGTIRNNFGSHGGGPTPPYGKPDERHAAHHMHITASHILMLVKLASL